MSNARTLANTINSSSQIVVPSGGIAFTDLNSSNDSTTANEAYVMGQDGYEEGTWIATFAGTTGTATGYYTKIGRAVYAYVYSTGFNVTSATLAVIGGLPFTCDTSYSAGVLSHNDYVSNAENGYTQLNTTDFKITSNSSVNTATTTVGNPKYVMMSVFYFTTA